MRFLHDRRRESNARRSFVAVVVAGSVALAPCLAEPARAQSERMLVQGSQLAGFSHHDAGDVFAGLRVGDTLQLAREPENAFDVNAIRVEWRGRKLGYVPRDQNAALAQAMDRGQALSARITRLSRHPDPRRRIEFDVYQE
jgi:hypothetical protein